MSTDSSKQSVGSEIYSGAASFGVAWALIGAIFATIISIILFGVGIYFLTRKIDRDSYSATVLYINGPGGPPCQKTQDNPVQYSCTVTIKYDGYPSPIDINYTGNQVYYVGQKITIYVKKGNPTDITLDKPTPKWFGWFMIAGAICLLLISWFWYWASRKWKFIAAAEGVGGAVNIISGGRW